jgi:hypothetical protein
MSATPFFKKECKRLCAVRHESYNFTARSNYAQQLDVSVRRPKNNQSPRYMIAHHEK